MITSPFFSLFSIPSSKITYPAVGFPNIKSFVRNKPSFNSISIADNFHSCCCSSTSINNSLTLDHDGASDEELQKAESKFGSRVRVKVPLKVYHVPKSPEFELMGRVGVLRQYVGFHQGKRISANLPYKVDFLADEILGRDGKPVKVTVHLREDEFEFLD